MWYHSLCIFKAELKLLTYSRLRVSFYVVIFKLLMGLFLCSYRLPIYHGNIFFTLP